MSVRTLLVSIDGGRSSEATLETALVIGRRLAVHVDVLHVQPDPLAAVPALGDGVTAQLADQAAAGAAGAGSERAAVAREIFDAAVTRHGLEVVEQDAPHAGFTVAWSTRVGRRHKMLARLGQVHDLVVVGHPSDPEDLDRSLTADALFATGRPVVVAPPHAPEAFGRRLAIAWNGSTECARAVGGASNFLDHAESAVVLTAQSERTPISTVPELETYLRRHGVEVETVRVGHPTKDHLGGRPLLDACADAGADMLVMGAHRVGRLRELVLGNATREVLREATLPVLMGH
ncbi:MAG: universal stress protein [Gammaproteobacteria bacterium]|nr:universal stress protein [Gammaproteobacteria bacterium]